MFSLIISPDGIKMDLKKVEVITAWPVSTKVKEIQLFLDLANFYRHFVDNFSKVAKPLHKLTHKDTQSGNGPRNVKSLLISSRIYLYHNLYYQW